MNNRRLIVCDPDRDYGTALADYIRRSECGYEVVMYSDPEIFVNDLRDKEVSLLLVQEGFLEQISRIFGGIEEVFKLDIRRMYILVEERTSLDQGDNTIYKYQSARNILSIIGEDIESRYRIVEETQHVQGVKLIGVYSPINHTLKTTFAMTLGHILSEREPVLYINLEGYSGLYELLDIKSETGLLDLMYDFSLNPDDLMNILFKYTVRTDELSVLIPAKTPFELQEVDTGLWMSFLSSLTGSGKYGTIILDISDAARGALDIMNVCTRVYMPLRKDSISVAKHKDFTDAILKYPGGEELNSRIIKLKFPYFQDMDGSISDLKHSRLARYIRNEICDGNE